MYREEKQREDESECVPGFQAQEKVSKIVHVKGVPYVCSN